VGGFNYKGRIVRALHDILNGGEGSTLYLLLRVPAMRLTHRSCDIRGPGIAVRKLMSYYARYCSI